MVKKEETLIIYTDIKIYNLSFAFYQLWKIRANFILLLQNHAILFCPHEYINIVMFLTWNHL